MTLDDNLFRRFANEDHIGSVRNLKSAVIDEIQFAPDLFLAIKKDSMTRPNLEDS